MPITRSGASGNKKPDISGKESTNVLKKTKGKAPKREAEKEVDVPPQKTTRKAVNSKDTEESDAKKVTKSKKTQKREKDQLEEPLDIEESDDASQEKENAETIYEFTAKDIQGNEISLDKYKDHVCIIVNVASKCGHTKSNYEQLVEIFDKYSEENGLRILAFPCNQFGKQEPADNEKICEFAEKKSVKFDMYEKIEVKGKGAHPLWKFLTSKIGGPKGKDIDWNFTKFIIDKEGKVVERHAPTVKPQKLVENLEKYW